MNQYIRWVNDTRLKDRLLVGNKFANLGELSFIGIPIPFCFCITSEAYKKYIEHSNLKSKIDRIIANTILHDPESIEKSSNSIKQSISNGDILKAVMTSIEEAYKIFCISHNENDTSVAIRSSGIFEDMPTDSFAGQYSTFLNIAGIDNIIPVIKECWASLYSKKAIFYRAQRGYSHTDLLMAVIIQKMIPANISGVMFTESLSGNEQEMIINSVWGLGESLVSGKVNSDCFIVSKNQKCVIDQYIETKETKIVCNPQAGIKNVAVPKNEKKISSLDLEQIKKLISIGEEIEKHYECSQDIEWCIANENLTILQTRSITSLQSLNSISKFPLKWENESDKKIVWIKGMGVPARFVDPVTPLSFELVKIILSHCWDDAMKKLPIPYKTRRVEFRLFNSYLYWNIDLEEKPKISLRLFVFLIKLFKAVKIGIEKWRNYLPVYMYGIEKLKKLNTNSASLSELQDQFKKICELFYRYFVWEVYLGETIDAFFEIYLDAISKLTHESRLIVAKLVQGVDSKTKEMNEELSKIIAKARKESDIKDIILSGLSYEDFNKKLKKSKNGLRFLSYFNDFLKRYGHRSPKPDWFFPSWKEDPSPIINYIKEKLQHNHYSFEEVFKEQILEREKLTSQIKIKLKHNPLKRVLFSWFLKTAQRWAPLREDRQHFVKLSSQLLKDTLNELNVRMIRRRILSDQNDIFFLTLDELDEVIQNMKKGVATDFRVEVEKRYKEWKSNFELTPPPRIIGPLVKDYLLTKGKKISGLPCSSGRVMGRARVISHPEDFKSFRYGEILIAPETGPEWILLFELARAIVTDYGMPLSHSALLAREFGLPGVCGTKIATGVIRNGQKIIVGGNNGIVVLL